MEGVQEDKERRYTLLGSSSVKLYAESTGSAIGEKVSSLLVDDVNYRIREIATTSKQFMRHGKRDRLTVGDMDKAMKMSAVPPLFGHGDESDPVYVTAPEVGVSATLDRSVDLAQFASEVDLDGLDTGQTTVKAGWSVIGDPNGTTPVAGGSAPNSALCGPVSWGSLRTYLSETCEALLGVDEEAQKMSLADLTTNPNIGPLYSSFVKFFHDAVVQLFREEGILQCLLSAAEAFTSNQCVFSELEPSAESLSNSLLFVTLNQEPIRFGIRDYSAAILSKLVSEWRYSGRHLSKKLLRVYSERLAGSGSLGSLYGALSGLLALGSKVCCEYVHTHAIALLDFLSLADKETATSPLYMDIRDKLKDLLSSPILLELSSHESTLSEFSLSLYTQLVDILGESFTIPLASTATVRLQTTETPPNSQSKRLKLWYVNPMDCGEACEGKSATTKAQVYPDEIRKKVGSCSRMSLSNIGADSAFPDRAKPVSRLKNVTLNYGKAVTLSSVSSGPKMSLDSGVSDVTMIDSTAVSSSETSANQLISEASSRAFSNVLSVTKGKIRLKPTQTSVSSLSASVSMLSQLSL